MLRFFASIGMQKQRGAYQIGTRNLSALTTSTGNTDGDAAFSLLMDLHSKPIVIQYDNVHIIWAILCWTQWDLVGLCRTL